MSGDFNLHIDGVTEYWAIVNAARDNGSLDSLLERIATFSLNAGAVLLTPSATGLQFVVAWSRDVDEPPYMVGALIYNDSDNTWSVHS